MEPIIKSLEEYIKSGDYFVDAKKWYDFKYIYPSSHRSFLIFLGSSILVLFIVLLLSIYSLLPIVMPVRYSLYTASHENRANIKRANQIEKDALTSIADIMIRSYIMHRESYNYNDLKQQFMFVQNNSTRMVFRKFFNYMSIDNTLSPVMRYKKYIKRNINIISSSYETPGEAIIIFSSTAKTPEDTMFEDIVWQAVVNYNIDNINLNALSNTKFNFVVTNYYLKLLQNKVKQ